MDPVTKITKARVKLLLEQDFVRHAIMKLRLKEFQGTMATDGIHMFYDPEFVERITFNQLIGVCAHELFHVVFLHPFRKGDRDHTRWNIACDHAINLIVKDDLHLELPEDALYDPKYRGKTAEWIYDNLPENAGPEPKWGLVLEAKETEEEGTIKEQETEWKATVKAAIMAAGKLPGNLSQMLDITHATVNWRDQLSRFMQASIKTDYAWYPPHQVYIQHHLHVPTLNEPSLGDIIINIDTSSSVSNDELSMFFGELQGILDHLQFQSLTVMQTDTQIQNITEYECLDDLKNVKVYGRGGTYFAPAFEEASQRPCDVMLFFTDMEPCDGFGDAPGFPVIWVRTQNTDAPYGDYVDLWRH
jgi:predicted metal-dependent peptidase